MLLGCSGGEGGVASSSVFVEGDAVHADGKTEQVDVLTCVADGVGSAEPHGVVEVAVDGLGVVSAGVQRGEVGVVGCDGSYVFGAVEAAFVVLGVAVESNGDGAGSGPVGEAVVVVPTESSGGAVAVAAGPP